jgi:hypothetical protein
MLDYQRKSVRRRVIDNIMEQWRNNSLNTLRIELDRNFQYGFSRGILKTFTQILNGKKACEGSIFKRHEDAKRWFKNCIHIIDNVIEATVIGVEAHFSQSSSIASFHKSYYDTGVSFYTYTIVLHGKIENGNECCFTVNLLSDHFELVK